MAIRRPVTPPRLPLPGAQDGRGGQVAVAGNLAA